MQLRRRGTFNAGHLGFPRSRYALLALGCVGAVGACAAEPEGGRWLRGELTRSDGIVRAVGEATAYPYVCTVRMGSSSACSGSLVARNVVLTAAHCVEGERSFTVTCPYSGDTASASSREAVMSPTGGDSFAGDYITPESGSDVALIHLDRDIRATRFGSVRLVNVAPPQRVFVIGRINDGTFTNRLWISPPFNAIWRYGSGLIPNAIGANTGVTQSGDSGGALFDATTQEIIGVVSGGSDYTSIYGVVGKQADWYRSTLARWSGAAPPSPPPSMPPSMPPSPPSDECAAQATSCGACTPIAGCGWCGATSACISVDRDGVPLAACASGFALNPPDCAPPMTPAPPPGPARPPGASETCGRYEGWDNRSCVSGSEMVRCMGSSLERVQCAPGGSCIGRPAGFDDVCVPPPGEGEPCGEYDWIDVFTCNQSHTQRVICVNGRLLREPCAHGCVTYPEGVDDLCAP